MNISEAASACCGIAQACGHLRVGGRAAGRARCPRARLEPEQVVGFGRTVAGLGPRRLDSAKPIGAQEAFARRPVCRGVQGVQRDFQGRDKTHPGMMKTCDAPPSVPAIRTFVATSTCGVHTVVPRFRSGWRKSSWRIESGLLSNLVDDVVIRQRRSRVFLRRFNAGPR